MNKIILALANLRAQEAKADYLRSQLTGYDDDTDAAIRPVLAETYQAIHVYRQLVDKYLLQD